MLAVVGYVGVVSEGYVDQLIGFVAVVGASTYALARLLQVSLTTTAIRRYAGIVALLRFGLGSWTINFEGDAIVLAIPLIVIAFVLTVRLFALPGLLITEHSVRSALRQSWDLTKVHGWSLFGIVILLGLLNHLLTSVPVIGSLGSALVGVLHASTVTVFLQQIEYIGR
jgi:hypothetical protein